MTDISILIGKTITKILHEDNAKSYNDDNEFLIFECEDGTRYKMTHDQDCCENVYLETKLEEFEEILTNTPILAVDEVTREMTKAEDEDMDSSGTWTFYNFRTLKGYVTLRWNGQSNGYYSEAVDFYELDSEGKNKDGW